MNAKRIFVSLAAFLLALAPAFSAGQSFENLLQAASKGDIPVVGTLLNQGLDPNTADSDGNTLLMLAARQGHQEMVSFLISRKASVTRRSPHGDTALMLASIKGHIAAAKVLLENGAEITHSGWTPIHYAAFEGRAEMIKFLIEKGAAKNGLAPNGFTPLMLTARGGHVAAARVLLYEDVDLYVRGPKGETALSITRAGKFAELEALLTRAGAIN